jgi:protein-L-isoaspartate(D-aspartate) O-methyltransferase
MDPAVLREDMVDGIEHAAGEIPERVAAALRTVPRHEFLDERPYDNREADHRGTRVLAPREVARLLAALDPELGDTTLVVGAGVGYTAAVVAEMTAARDVHAVDITRPVVYDARANLAAAGYDAVLVDCRDGAEGLPEYADFDRILVEAAAVEPPRRLLAQLSPDGRLVMPLGGPDQTLVALAPDDGDGGGAGAGTTATASRREAAGRDPGYEVVGEFGSAAYGPMLVSGEEAGGRARNRTEREDREFAEQGYFARTGWEYEWIDWDDRLDSGRGHHPRGRR